MKSRSRNRIRSLSRKAIVLGLLAGSLLAWQIAVISLEASQDGLAPVSYFSESPAAMTKDADQHLADGDAAGAKVLATEALASSPISAKALRDLALAEQQLGNLQQSGALFSQSAALGWRDAPTQYWLALAFAQEKRYTEAAQRMDAALRIAPDSTYLYGALDTLLEDPAFAKAMTERLTINPHWRSYYLSYARQPSLDSIQAKARLLEDLIAIKTSPSRDEMIPTLSWLVHYGQYRRARALWLASRHVRAAVLYDPGFSDIQDGNASPFEWARLQIPLGGIKLDRSLVSGLSISTDGTATGAILRQTVILAPGAHQLGPGGVVSGKADSVFGWQVRCMGNGAIILNTLRLPPQSIYRFVVPESCPGQILELRVTGSLSASDINVSFRRLDLQ